MDVYSRLIQTCYVCLCRIWRLSEFPMPARRSLHSVASIRTIAIQSNVHMFMYSWGDRTHMRDKWGRRSIFDIWNLKIYNPLIPTLYDMISYKNLTLGPPRGHVTPGIIILCFMQKHHKYNVVVSFRSDGTNVDTQAWQSGEINVNMSGV